MLLYTILLVLHVIISICLMIVVLVQSGKGGGLSGAFGGAGAAQTMFGGRGAGDVLTRTTQILGGAFMSTSLVLVLLGGSGNRTGLSSESERIIQEIQQEAIRQSQPLDALPPLEGLSTDPGALGTIDLPGAAAPPGGPGPAGSEPPAATETPPDEGG